jgi:uncharacterized protein (TIGR02270 family)
MSTTHRVEPPAILWDVVEEHLEEAAFLAEQHARASDSPTLDLAGLERGEARLAAHLDGLLQGGAPVYERIVEKALLEPDPEDPSRVVAAALVALGSGRFRALEPLLGHEAPEVRDAAVHACSLAGGASGSPIDDWLHARLRDLTGSAERASLLRIVGRRGLDAVTLVAWLQGDDPQIARAAATAARHADGRRHMAVIEYLLDHPDAEVREAALVTALAWRSHRASVLCESWALEDTPRPLPMALYAMLGGPPQHDRLARKLALPAHRRGALFALGFSGNLAQLPALMPFLSGPDPVVARIAAQAISTIVGIDLGAAPFVAAPPAAGAAAPAQDPEAASALPPLEEDDLEADLAPVPEEGLPVPNAEAIRIFCERSTSSLAPGGRYLGGRPAGLEVSLGYLERAPLRRRHVLALGVGIQTGGKVWIDTRAFAPAQRRHIARARAVSSR